VDSLARSQSRIGASSARSKSRSGGIRKYLAAPKSPKEVSMAESNDRRHNDNRVMCLRIFADASGETHMEDFEIAFQPRKLFEDNPPLRLSHNFPTSWCNICHVPSGMGEVDWHNPPQRLLVLWLSGEVEFETSDGDVRRLPAGSVVLAEDTSGKGHISRHPPEGQLVVHVALADQQSFARSASAVGISRT
jgi:hypothetical protein